MRVDERLRDDIVAAVQKVEASSAAEVVVTIVPRSSSHWDVALATALVVVFLVQGVAAAFFGGISAFDVALDSAVLAAVVIGLVRGFVPLQRLLLPSRVAARRVEAGAESAFCRQGIFRTRDHTGVLLYVSSLERRAVLLPDDELVKAIPAEALASLRAQTNALLRGPDPRQALLTLLDQLRRVTARHLPPRADDINELPDAPVTQ